jgi:hypothetical protein
VSAKHPKHTSNSSILLAGLALATAANRLEVALQNELRSTLTPNNPSIEIYAFDEIFSFWTFFGAAQQQPFQHQYGISNISPTRVSAAFTYVRIDAAGTLQLATTDSGSPTIQQAAIVHEMGHHLDWIWGPLGVFHSSQSGWTGLASSDTAFIDSQPCNQVFLLSTCTANMGIPNHTILSQKFGAVISSGEMFGLMFEHVEKLRTGAFTAVPELEQALEFLPMEKQYMLNNTASPPPPVQ